MYDRGREWTKDTKHLKKEKKCDLLHCKINKFSHNVYYSLKLLKEQTLNVSLMKNDK